MKKIILVIVFLVISISGFSATRQEIQIAMDLIKSVNVANDLVDSSIPVIKGEVKKQIMNGFEVVGEEDMTVDEIKARVVRLAENVDNYKKKFNSFLLDADNNQKAINGLSAWGVDLQSLKTDIDFIGTTTMSHKTNIGNIKDINDLKVVATDLESKIDPLPLVRKTK